MKRFSGDCPLLTKMYCVSLSLLLIFNFFTMRLDAEGLDASDFYLNSVEKYSDYYSSYTELSSYAKQFECNLALAFSDTFSFVISGDDSDTSQVPIGEFSLDQIKTRLGCNISSLDLEPKFIEDLGTYEVTEYGNNEKLVTSNISFSYYFDTYNNCLIQVCNITNDSVDFIHSSFAVWSEEDAYAFDSETQEWVNETRKVCVAYYEK